ncbi:hypothetical protein GALL_284660 [mine drainage metagenome]|uniref:Uncharacterized protein n=1 Tax=mine drainage metagenome TaxID=410659 RepID=A0A1J5RJ67_9ZZZZ
MNPCSFGTSHCVANDGVQLTTMARRCVRVSLAVARPIKASASWQAVWYSRPAAVRASPRGRRSNKGQPRNSSSLRSCSVCSSRRVTSTTVHTAIGLPCGCGSSLPDRSQLISSPSRHLRCTLSNCTAPDSYIRGYRSWMRWNSIGSAYSDIVGWPTSSSTPS